MSSWLWRLESADGTVVDEQSPDSAVLPANPAHTNQSDAESWLGETWRQLAAAGVAQVTLFEDEKLVYGPMPLSEA
ncbi:MAG TPA: hypothetical protein VGL26_06390 [Jatrophihabitans sp.]|jgi:hypothetical protein